MIFEHISQCTSPHASDGEGEGEEGIHWGGPGGMHRGRGPEKYTGEVRGMRRGRVEGCAGEVPEGCAGEGACVLRVGRVGAPQRTVVGGGRGRKVARWVGWRTTEGMGNVYDIP